MAASLHTWGSMVYGGCAVVLECDNLVCVSGNCTATSICPLFCSIIFSRVSGFFLLIDLHPLNVYKMNKSAKVLITMSHYFIKLYSYILL